MQNVKQKEEREHWNVFATFGKNITVFGSLGGQLSHTSLNPRVCLLSRRGNSTNQKDYKTLSARLCKCFHSYKIHFCSQFVLYIHQIGRFYIGWMDNINSSPSLIETTSKTLGNVYVFHRLTSWRKVQRHFMKIHELLIWSTPVLYISEALRIWIESYLKATKKGNYKKLP